MSDATRQIAPPPLLRLASRNALRNRRRTLLTGSAIVVAVAAVIFMLAYMRGIIANVEDTFARTQSGHARVTRQGYAERERFSPLYLYVPDVTALVSRLRSQPEVGEALPRIRAAVLASTDSVNTGALLLGVDIPREEGYMRPARMLARGRLPAAGRAEALLGVGLAEKLGVSAGDSITLLGQTAWRSFGGLRVEIAGVGRSGVPHLDRALILLPLDQAQLLTELDDAATEVLVFARDRADADRLAGMLAARLPSTKRAALDVASWRGEGTLLQTIEVGRRIWTVLLLVLMTMAGLIIVNTMLMTVLERTRELGMLAALGMRRSWLVRLVVLEGLVIGALGTAAGAALGSGVALWLGAVGLDFSAAMERVELPLEPIIHPDWHWTHLIIGSALGLFTGAVAALYPARQAARMPPAEALRR